MLPPALQHPSRKRRETTPLPRRAIVLIAVVDRIRRRATSFLLSFWRPSSPPVPTTLYHRYRRPRSAVMRYDDNEEVVCAPTDDYCGEALRGRGCLDFINKERPCSLLGMADAWPAGDCCFQNPPLVSPRSCKNANATNLLQSCSVWRRLAAYSSRARQSELPLALARSWLYRQRGRQAIVILRAHQALPKREER